MSVLAACGNDMNRPVSLAPDGGPQQSNALATVAIDTELVATTVTAVDLAVRPGDPAFYVVEHAGRVVRIDDDGSTVVLDIRDRLVDHRDEQGLTGLEFDSDGRTAWLHATGADGLTRISEVPVDSDGAFDLDRERVMIDVGAPPAPFHNAGDLLLAPDGTLLITLGDGAAFVADGNLVSDPNRVGHDPSSLRGSILRVRPTPGGPDTHEIPSDNPFAAGPIAAPDGSIVEGRPEVWAWGLRNPWKIHLDPVTGDLWIADVGQDEAEEINRVSPVGGGLAGRAADFGWSQFEGSVPINADVPTLLEPPIDPVWDYPHVDIRCAISGGVVYRGDEIPDLRGGYVFGDFCEGSLWVYDPVADDARRLRGDAGGAGGIAGISGIRTGPDGELYVVTWFGELHKIVAV